jgi:hypothetical protein
MELYEHKLRNKVFLTPFLCALSLNSMKYSVLKIDRKIQNSREFEILLKNNNNKN